MRRRLFARSSLSVVAALALTLASPMYANADSLFIDFETPAYHVGTIQGQQGWSGSLVVPINPAIDQEVVLNTYGYKTFGGQSWRMSNA